LKHWKLGTPFSNKKLWLRKTRPSFRLYYRLVITFLFVILSSTLIVLSENDSPVVHKLRTTLLSVARPFIFVFNKPFEWASDTKNFFASWATTHKTNKLLEEEVNHLKELVTSLEGMQKENSHLNQLLAVKQHLKKPSVTTKVLAYPERPYVKSIVIEAGEDDGIKSQQVALHQKGLVGRVIYVAKNLSYVLLITDVNSRVPVTIRGKEEQAILIGTNSGLPFLKYAQAKNIQQGDIVDTSGHGGVFPPGIPVGHVIEVDGESILVQPFVDVDHLSFVMLLEPVLNETIQMLVNHEAFDPA
jgi:rod shape-determining protein MreC